ncbi:MAG: ferrous iron transport protein B [Deltaproteobacteria bacterium]|nr:ferrous iron transport protein B [Deltaproteobacteria bacterium]
MIRIALAGNPNSGKTTVFNALTGSQQKIANYGGVTVEKKEGAFKSKKGKNIIVLDLPGTYSLDATSPDEQIAQEVLLGLRKDTEKPHAIVVVVDADNLERHLYLTLQLKETGTPIIIALNMMDIAQRHNKKINIEELSNKLGVPVVPMVARSELGIQALKDFLEEEKFTSIDIQRKWKLSPPLEELCSRVSQKLVLKNLVAEEVSDFYARGLLRTKNSPLSQVLKLPEDLQKYLTQCLNQLAWQGIHFSEEEISARYQWIEKILSTVLHHPSESQITWTEKIDKVLLHKVAGPFIFFGLIAILFQSIFTWATYPMDVIDTTFGWLSVQVENIVPSSFLRDLFVEGVIGGVGSVIIFLPQILLLFFFICLLEDTGYMARAAFLMDRLMARVGLSGKSFIPLLSSFACAIPGVMACRTIENKRDRFTTMLVAPLTTCSARLPVYALLIGAFVPAIPLAFGLTLPGVTLFGLYLLGIIGVIGAAWVFRKTIFRGEAPPVILELPTYKMPQLKVVLRNMWNRSKMFVRRAGTIILSMSIVLWLLSSFPKNPELENKLVLEGASPQVVSSNMLEQSYAGRIGKFIEPVIKPLGFDWKIGIGLVASFAAREVFVSTMATIYQVEGADEESLSLRESLQRDTNLTPLVAMSLLVFYVFACQCMSTIAIVRRETNSWRWPLFMVAYMTALAYVAALLVYQVGSILF